MAKVTIDLPNSFPFNTCIDVLIQHINIGNHLANEHLIAFLNEARVRFSNSLNYDSVGISAHNFINADLAVIYKSEGHHGDCLRIDVAAQDFSKYGCDFVYKVSKKETGEIVAIAKTAMLHFDYNEKRLTAVPNNFEDLFKID
ncbi:MAG: thioesterase family protein [Sinobacterium sp.]|nr:thioesterase family protein [Sinobacterium sp.]